MYHLLKLNYTSFLLGLGLAAALRAGNMKEITYKELLKLPRDSYTLVDTRDEGSTQYGTIPGSLHIEEKELKKERKLMKNLQKLHQHFNNLIKC